MATVYESDVCIIGGGISAAMLAEKLAELRPGIKITVVEAGRKIFDVGNRAKYARREQDYGDNSWPNDSIEDQVSNGQISRTMAVGGQALHWGGTCNRYSEEDLRLKSMYGLYVDWSMEWKELEKYCCEAEHRLGVSGEPSSYAEDRRSQPYPMPPMPLTYDLIQYKAWGDKSGYIFQGVPQAKNTKSWGGRSVCLRCGTCAICPTGAKYSPDFTFKGLLQVNKITLHDRTLVRKLVLDEKSAKIVKAEASNYEQPDEKIEYRAGTFVLASGHIWSTHLLLLSSCSRFPNGLANSTDQVGRYMNGHGNYSAMIEFESDEVFPGMNNGYSLISRKFLRSPVDKTYMRHDLRIFPSGVGIPRVQDKEGQLLLGDDLLSSWKQKQRSRPVARCRAYYDIHPSPESRLTLNAAKKNRWGDPLPDVFHDADAATKARAAETKEHINGVFDHMAKAGDGKVLQYIDGDYLDHPGGGCRMGTDPAASVCDSFGRTHDHANLFVVGAPTIPAASVTNGTLAFVALTLRSAEEVARDIPNRQV
jgi:choline dehydrogenase-like flavoprotein